MKSRITYPANHHFSIYNFPFGVYQSPAGPRVASVIGDNLIDLAQLNTTGVLSALQIPQSTLENKYLNDFISLGKATTNGLRLRLQTLFSEGNTEAVAYDAQMLKPLAECTMLMPVHIGDYTDFYSSIDHATNVGKMFRDPANALLPNWRHLPVGYHGRSSSIILSGQNIHRPKGQVKPDADELPHFTPTRLLDFELEMAFIVGKETQLGESISTAQAQDHIFGMVIFNDWSARDIQKWEYVPLGPFLAKNFASSISPWVVTIEALQPFRVAGAVQEPAVLPYLQYEGDNNIDIALEVSITPPNGTKNIVCQSNYKHMYWTMEQQLTHHTVNGCNVRVGDTMASGTISGPTEGSFGSMLELSWGGKNPITLNDGTERKFINDGDTVTITAVAQQGDMVVGFGDVTTTILPAL